MRDLLDLVVIKVEENQIGQRDKVLNLCDMIMLQVEETEALLSFKKRHVRQVALVEIEPFGVGLALTRLAVHDEHAGDLRQLREDDFVLVFHASDDSVLEQVSIALIILHSILVRS